MNTRLHVACLLLVAAVQLPAQSPDELPPVVARLVKTYDRAPNGEEFFRIFSAAVDLHDAALWVRYGEPDDPPVRIDRKTGVARVIGRHGSGPNEYQTTYDLVSGPNGLIGTWDTGRRLWFWIDADGAQRATWRVPTGNLMMGKVFSDDKGRVFIGQRPFVGGAFGPAIIVRVDSARGLTDTMPVPFSESLRWSWSTRGSSGVTSGTRVMFAPSVDWGVDRRGRLFASWTDSNFVQIMDVRVTRLWMPAFKEPMSAADRDAATKALDQFENYQRGRKAEFLGPRPPIPQFRSEITRVVPELNGGLAVERSRNCAGFSNWKAPITGAPSDTTRCVVVERFDANRRRLTPFTLTIRDRLLAVRADTAWISRRDSDDLQKVLELVIPRR